MAPRASPPCAHPSCRGGCSFPLLVQPLQPRCRTEPSSAPAGWRALSAAPSSAGAAPEPRDVSAPPGTAERRQRLGGDSDRGGNLKINNCICRSLELAGSTEWEKPFFLCNAGGAAGNPQFTSHRSCCFGMEQLLFRDGAAAVGCLCSSVTLMVPLLLCQMQQV